MYFLCETPNTYLAFAYAQRSKVKRCRSPRSTLSQCPAWLQLIQQSIETHLGSRDLIRLAVLQAKVKKRRLLESTILQALNDTDWLRNHRICICGLKNLSICVYFEVHSSHYCVERLQNVCVKNKVAVWPS